METSVSHTPEEEAKMFPLTSEKKVSTDIRIESVGQNFARLLRAYPKTVSR